MGEYSSMVLRTIMRPSLSEFIDELINHDKDKVLYYLKLILYFFAGESVVFMNLLSSFRKRLHRVPANV
jgi:hypothetical protein